MSNKISGFSAAEPVAPLVAQASVVNTAKAVQQRTAEKMRHLETIKNLEQERRALGAAAPPSPTVPQGKTLAKALRALARA